MRKNIVITLVIATSLAIASCGENDIDTFDANRVETSHTASFSDETATHVHEEINNTLANPSSTEHDLLKYATPKYISQLGEEYGGYSYNEIHNAFIERSQYWEHDEPVNETIKNSQSNDTTATSQRELTSSMYSYAKAPETLTCTIYDNWIKDSEGWKLDFVDDKECKTAPKETVAKQEGFPPSLRHEEPQGL